MSAKTITTKGFLEEFQRRHEQMPDRAFCFILGAGASVQSGIPTGKQLVKEWLEVLHTNEDFCNLPLKDWANPDNLRIVGVRIRKVRVVLSRGLQTAI